MGRPISLFSFAIQHQSWPANPAAFKIINLLIHLLCGLLIYKICRKVSNYIKLEIQESIIFSLLTTLIWLIHPINITTVLYVVQRMTQLSALFMLSGVYFYIVLIEKYFLTGEYKWLLWNMSVVWGCMLLAIFSKENGILLPFYILIISNLLFRDKHDSVSKKLSGIMIWLPLFCLAVYLALGFEDVVKGYHYRPFTIYERVITQFVVICDYLKHILVFYPADVTLFHDDFPVSKGLLSPPLTLLCLLVIIGMLFTGWSLRKKYPFFLFAVLWFFFGHLLESTYLNLELYFDHRNYLPSAGIIMLVSYLIVQVYRKLQNNLTVSLIILTYILSISSVAATSIKLFQDPVLKSMDEYNKHPDSKRAMIALGNQYIAVNDLDQAVNLYDLMNQKYPGTFYPELKIRAIDWCVKQEKNDENKWNDLITRAATGKKDGFGVIEELTIITSSLYNGDCRGIDINNFVIMIVNLISNPEFSGDRAQLHELAARLGLLMGDPGVAYHNANAAVRYSPTLPRLYLKFIILMELGEKNDAISIYKEMQSRLDENIFDRLAYKSLVEQAKYYMDKKTETGK